MSPSSLRRTASFAVYGLLFVALVLVLLRFQGLIGRPEHDLAEVNPAGVPVGSEVGGAERTQEVTARRETVPVLEFHPARVEAVDPARLAARVMASVTEVLVREGDDVAEGALLVSLDAKDAEARRAQALAGVEAANARLTAADAAYERAEKLLAGGNLTPQAFEGARAERDAARALEDVAREALGEANTALAWHRISAPFAGRVLERAVERGDLAQPGRTLVALYRTDALRVVAGVPERHVDLVAAGRTVALDFGAGGSLELPISRVLPETDSGTGTLLFHVDLPADVLVGRDLRPGALGRVGLATGERTRLVIPEAAVERIGQVERVWLVREGHARPVNVRTVPGNGDDLAEVLFGLEEGDRVLAR